MSDPTRRKQLAPIIDALMGYWLQATHEHTELAEWWETQAADAALEMASLVLEELAVRGLTIENSSLRDELDSLRTAAQATTDSHDAMFLGDNWPSEEKAYAHLATILDLKAVLEGTLEEQP